jgi:hypothetical protein
MFPKYTYVLMRKLIKNTREQSLNFSNLKRIDVFSALKQDYMYKYKIQERGENYG